MLHCLNCGQFKAHALPEHIECSECDYQWSYEDEQAQAHRIWKLYQRKPHTPPVYSLAVDDVVDELDDDVVDDVVDELDGLSSDEIILKLTTIKHIGTIRAEDLVNKGLYTVEQVAETTPKKIMNALDVSSGMALEIIASANQIINGG